nr:26S proteasome non-ATPase regulatory subunit 7 homolog A-like [Ipomoea batatas]
MAAEMNTLDSVLCDFGRLLVLWLVPERGWVNVDAGSEVDKPLSMGAKKRRTEGETKATGVAVVGRTEENGGDVKAAKVLRYCLTEGEGLLAITACSASSNKTGEKVATRGGYRCVVALAVGGTKSTAEAAPLPQSAAELVVLSSTGKEDRHCRCMENVGGVAAKKSGDVTKLQIGVKPKELGIPTKAYYAVEEVKENATQKSQVFVHVPSEIAAHEVEEIGVEHLLRDVKDTTISTLATELNDAEAVRSSLVTSQHQATTLELRLWFVAVGIVEAACGLRRDNEVRWAPLLPINLDDGGIFPCSPAASLWQHQVKTSGFYVPSLSLSSSRFRGSIAATKAARRWRANAAVEVDELLLSVQYAKQSSSG